MGWVVNKTLKQCYKDIEKKELLHQFLNTTQGDKTLSSSYLDKLAGLCERLVEEISNLDEIEEEE